MADTLTESIYGSNMWSKAKDYIKDHTSPRFQEKISRNHPFCTWGNVIDAFFECYPDGNTSSSTEDRQALIKATKTSPGAENVPKSYPQFLINHFNGKQEGFAHAIEDLLAPRAPFDQVPTNRAIMAMSIYMQTLPQYIRQKLERL